MKITIYELLGLIKDGKAPMKFKYKNKVFYSLDNDYWCDEIGGWFSVEVLDISILNDEVEIIEDTLKVKVTKSSRNTYWYANHIGKKFEVKDTMVCGYKVIDGIHKDAYIEYEDSEIIEEDKKIEKLVEIKRSEMDDDYYTFIMQNRYKINELIEEIEKLKGKSE